MRITKNQIQTIDQLTQAVKEPLNFLQKSARSIHSSSASTPPLSPLARNRKGRSDGENNKDNFHGIKRTAIKCATYLAAAGYAYDKIANDFFLSTTSLHDGKSGFTSDHRLHEAEKKA